MRCMRLAGPNNTRVDAPVPARPLPQPQPAGGRRKLQAVAAGDNQDAAITVDTAAANIATLAGQINEILRCFAVDTAYVAGGTNAYVATGYLKIRCPVKFG